MFDKDKSIKVIVVSQSITLNGKKHTLISHEIGTIMDATPIYGDVHNSIIGYYIFYTNSGSNYIWEGRLPFDLFMPIAKHRQEQIDSIFED